MTIAEGELQARLGSVACGWAFLPATPEERAVVEILADGYPIGTAVANLFDAQLLARRVGDGCHAFVYPIPPRLLDQTCRLTARIANLGVVLPGSVLTQRVDSEPRPPGLIGNVSNRGDLRLSGWVWDAQVPHTAHTVSFYEGNVGLGSCLADQADAELIDKGFGDGRFGFSFTLPARLQDGREHAVRVMVGEREFARVNVIGLPAHVEPVYAALLQLPQVAADATLATQIHALQAERAMMHERLPRSFDFARYPDWLAAWGRVPLPPAEGTPAKVLVLIDGEGDPTATLASLHAQPDVDWQALVVTHRRGLGDMPRVRWISRRAVSTGLRAALAAHDGIVTYVRAGDRFAAGALPHLVRILQQARGPACVYGDSDGPGAQRQAATASEHPGLQPGEHSRWQPAGPPTARLPWFKPDWDPHLHLATGYAGQVFACTAACLRLQALAVMAAPGDIVDLALAACADDNAIRHEPYVLCHHARWPAAPAPDSDASGQLLAQALPGARLVAAEGRNRIVAPPPKSWPKVSLIVPTRDRLDLLEPCIASLRSTDYPALEIVVADNDSNEPATGRWLRAAQRARRVKVVPAPGSFNYSRINNAAVAAASGAIIGLVNNDIEARDPGWLKIMVAQLLLPGVGAVGAKLTWPNGMVQHAGVVTGLNGVAGHAGNRWFADDAGYFGLNQTTRRVGAATAACLLLRKVDYEQGGGLDATWLPVNFNDVDLCLKLRERGLQVLWCAEAQLVHHESASRGSDHDLPQKAAGRRREIQALLERWGSRLLHDPYYNPNLNLDRDPYTGLAVPPRHWFS